MNAKDKRPGLLWKSVNYSRKKFYSTGPLVAYSFAYLGTHSIAQRLKMIDDGKMAKCQVDETTRNLVAHHQHFWFVIFAQFHSFIQGVPSK
jgi:hypothetical protein